MTRNEINKRLDVLYDFIFDGQVSLQYFHKIQSMTDSDSYLTKIMHPFILFTAQAHLKLAIINFSILLDKNRKSVSVPRFLNFLKSNGKKEYEKEWKNILKLIDISKNKINKIKIDYEDILNLRNQSIAHFDNIELKFKSIFKTLDFEIAQKIDCGFIEIKELLDSLCDTLKIGANIINEIREEKILNSTDLEDLEFILKRLTKIIDPQKMDEKTRYLISKMELS